MTTNVLSGSAPLSRPQATATEVIVGGERSGRRARAILEVFVLAALVPLGILLAGAPIAGAVRAVLSLITP
jgi:hypothetical protein